MTTRRGGPGRADEPPASHGGGLYEIKIQGHLDEHWLGWFEGLRFRYVKDPKTGLECTVLRGLLADQPALHGVLAKIRDLNLTLIAVVKPRPVHPESSGAGQRKPRSRPKKQPITQNHEQ